MNLVLILGRSARHSKGESLLDANQTPAQLRQAAELLVREAKAKAKVVCTFAPTVADHVVRLLREDDVPLAAIYQKIYVWDGLEDRALGDLKEPARLVHYSIADLFHDGEIGEVPDRTMGG